MSILFFLYVFGYLLRTKRKRKEKRLRKLSKWRESNMTNNHPTSEEESGSHDRISHKNASVSVENETVNMSPTREKSNPFVTNAAGHRRRFSRSDFIQEESSKYANQKPHPQHSKINQWPSNSSVNYIHSVDESPSDASKSRTFSASRSDVTRAGPNGPKIAKMKVSDNEHSHGSFFLRVGAVGQWVVINSNLIVFSFFDWFICKQLSDLGR